MDEEDEINILDIDHVYSILSFLRSRCGSDTFATELRQVMPNYGRMMAIIEQLELNGLVRLKVETRPRKRILISLTAKGTSVAEKLKELDKIIRTIR
jgi:predicted transcriptional regulator